MTTKDWYGCASPLLKTEQLTLPNGLTSQNTYTYADYNELALQTQNSQYDWGSNGVGPLLRNTITNYAAFPATPIYPSGPSIWDRPSSVIVYDGSNNRVAETDYSYDQTAVGTVSNLPSGTHDEANLQSLCYRDHKLKTRRENERRGHSLEGGYRGVAS